MNSWSTDLNSDNHILRSVAVNSLDLDIIGIAETHFPGNEQLEIDGYEWYGQNRRNIHRNAKCGSGGVGFLVNKDLLSEFNITILDDSVEGILWLRFTQKPDQVSFLACVCYLVPSNSSYQVNANDFFDSLLFQISQYQT